MGLAYSFLPNGAPLHMKIPASPSTEVPKKNDLALFQEDIVRISFKST